MSATKRRALAAMATAGILLLTAACGDDGDRGTDSTDPVDDDEAFRDAMLAYTDCMREQGIDMPDPQFTEDGGVSISAGADDGSTGTPNESGDLVEADFEAADEECGDILHDTFGEMERDPEAEAEMLDQMTEVAQCMRARGHDMPDPQLTEDGGFVIESRSEDGSGDGAAVAAGGAIDPDMLDDLAGLMDEDYLDDMVECQEQAGMIFESPEGDE